MSERFEDSIAEGLERLGAVQPETLARVRGSIRGLPERSPRRRLTGPLRGRRVGVLTAVAACLLVASVAFVAAPWRAQVISPSQSALTTSAIVKPTALGPTPSATLRPFTTPGGFVQAMHRFDRESGWVVVSPATGRAWLKITANGGETWRDATPPDSSSRSPVVQFVDPGHGWFLQPVDADSHATLSLWRTVDGGMHWEMGQLESTSGVSAAMSFTSRSSGFLLLSSPSIEGVEVYRTVDAGASWSRLQNLPGIGSFALGDDVTHHFAFVDDANGFAIASEGFVTHDAGRTWTQLVLPRPSYAPPGGAAWPSVLYAADGVALVVGSYSWSNNGVQESTDYLYASSDGGRTWRHVVTGATAPREAFAVVDGSLWIRFAGYASAIVGQYSTQVQVTHDGGVTWTPDYAQMPVDRHILDVSFGDALHGWATFAANRSCPPGPAACPFIPTFGGPLYETADGGRTWRAATNMH